MDRREFLRRTMAMGAGATALAAVPSRAAASPPVFASLAQAKNWNDPTAWASGTVPGPNDVAQVSGPVVLDTSVSVAGIMIMESGELYLEPTTSVTIESTGNIVVHGLFSLRPTPSAVHTVRFVGVKESAYIGGGHEVLDSDVGLWVQHNGLLDAVGTPKVAWNRTGNDATWSGSDQLIVTPTAAGDYDGFASFAKGSTVPKARGEFPAEVLNLTRNVVFEGTPGGRAHVIFVHAMQPQTVQYVEIRHMGPRQGPSGDSEGVTGRYPLHFHHCGDASRGSLIEGVAVHQSGNRAFVPHASHGITLRNCIAYDIMDDAFWWDLPVEGSPDNNTHDSFWDSCVAAWIKVDPPNRGFELAGFFLGHGNDNTCINSVAVGVQGNSGAAGYRWPQKGNSFHGVWEFRDNVSHNNRRHGMAVWQNNTSGHLVQQTLAYQMGGAAIHHGAYVNQYHYDNITAYDCENVINLHAQGKNGVPMMFTNVIGIDIRSDHVQINSHNLPGDGASFTGGILTSLEINNDPQNNGSNPGWYDFVDTGLQTSAVTLRSVAPGTVIRIQNGSDAWQISDAGAVTTIAPFADGGGTTPPTTVPSTSTTTTTTVGSTTTTTSAPTTTTTVASTTTTTTSSSGSGGNRVRRRRRRPPATGSAPAGAESTATGGDFVAFSNDASLAPSVGGPATPVSANAGPVTPPVLGIRGSAGAPIQASTGPIAKQLVSRAVPVSLNVPAALGPAQPSPAASAGLWDQISTPAGMAMTAAAAAAVALYRRRILRTEIPESLRSGTLVTSVPDELTDGDPWS